MAMLAITEESVRIAVAYMAGAKTPAAVKALEEFRAALQRAELPPSLADYDRMKAPEQDRTGQDRTGQRGMRRGPQKRQPKKISFRHPDDEAVSRAEVRAAIVVRSEGFCECGCGERVCDDRKTPCYPEARGEMDHFWGRRKAPETVETCWFLRPGCHLAKTRNQPDAATWLRRFMGHCQRYAFITQLRKAQARLKFVETRNALPAAPRTARR